MLECRPLYSRTGDVLRLIDDDEARELIVSGKAKTLHSKRGEIGVQLADVGPPMRGFPCGLSRAITRICPEDWPRGYWEHNQRATHWAEAL